MTPRTATSARKIAPAKGKLGILTPGMGAVATTFYAGVEAIRRELAKPIGSLHCRSIYGSFRSSKQAINEVMAGQLFVRHYDCDHHHNVCEYPNRSMYIFFITDQKPQ